MRLLASNAAMANTARKTGWAGPLRRVVATIRERLHGRTGTVDSRVHDVSTSWNGQMRLPGIADPHCWDAEQQDFKD